MGEIYAARCGWQRRRGIPGKGGWFTTKAQSGGGPLIDLGVHMIDLTMWLMGSPEAGVGHRLHIYEICRQRRFGLGQFNLRRKNG